MRVALDVTPLAGMPTGVATFVRGLVEALGERHDVELRAYGMTLRGRAQLVGAVPAGVRLCRRPMPARLLIEGWSRVAWPPAEWWTGAADVVHGTNFVVPPTAKAGAVVTVHDLTAVRFPELCAPASLRYPALVRRAAERGAWVHTPSEAVADEVREWLGQDERVRAVASGLDARRSTGGDPVAGHRQAGGERYVLAVGTVEPRKGLVGLVRAFDLMAGERPNLTLVIAGPDGWGAGDLTDTIAGARHCSRVRRLGWVDDRARADLLAGATVLAIPSVYEGFGYPALEAMAAGTPVVATAVGGLPEVVGRAGLLVAPGDTEALAGALASVIDDDAVAGELARAGPGQAARFRWQDCAAGLVELYGMAAETPR